LAPVAGGQPHASNPESRAILKPLSVKLKTIAPANRRETHRGLPFQKLAFSVLPFAHGVDAISLKSSGLDSASILQPRQVIF